MSDKQKLNVLVVDDEEDILVICESTLEEQGHVVYLASDGSDAKQLLENQTVFNDAPEIDVILTDWMMPEVSGVDLVKFVRKQGWDKVATVLMSGKVSTDDLKSGLQLGVDEILVKPFDPDTLRTKVMAAFQKRRGKKS